ncbi:MAG: IS110 family transposase [Actinomycetota bacterium]|nr:IS110 family transposase [Actinomycetota bacterium]MDP9486357.1 IS110 family transposase [Actinomycetota bacterium]
MRDTAPEPVALDGAGSDTAGALLIAGDNPERLKSEATFVYLCGTAPVPASWGRVIHRRLNPGGNRDTNRAMHVVATDCGATSTPGRASPVGRPRASRRRRPCGASNCEYAIETV